MASDLFDNIPPAPKAPGKAAGKGAEPPAPPIKDDPEDYGASSIRVLEGLEPVRIRPGMYIGGTDERGYHHLFAEVIDNSMDEAVAGHASFIEVALDADGYVSVTDNGRGIPVDEHPKFKGQSALQVIMTTLHSGGKFDGTAYEASGGLHGVGVSVVNALSDDLVVEVARNKKLYRQKFSKGICLGPIEELGPIQNRRGTSVRFHPDPQIFGDKMKFDPARLYKMARSKAYLYAGVEIRWKCDPSLLSASDPTPPEAVLHFPAGLESYLMETLGKEHLVARSIFSGSSGQSGRHGSVEWAIAWYGGDGFINSYTNTIPTPEGGTHEAGLRNVLLKVLKTFAERLGNKKMAQVTAEDVVVSIAAMLAVYIREPEFVGQTKDRLATTEATRIVEKAISDKFEQWLASNPQDAARLIDWMVERMDERMRRRKEKEVSRKTAVKKLRLPGKLSDCSQTGSAGAELFLVEGDSAGGSAKQARDRKTQAILPLRGKILNVASAGRDKLVANQLLSDLILALGAGTRGKYREDDLRYERIIIMTDADVDGAHIASLLITFFYQEMPELIRGGHLFLAQPPLYRITQGTKSMYARDDAHRAELIKSEFKGKGKIEIGRFKGLGEMMPAQLKETTMDPRVRTLLRVDIRSDQETQTEEIVTALMGTKPEERYKWISENARYAENLDI